MKKVLELIIPLLIIITTILAAFKQNWLLISINIIFLTVLYAQIITKVKLPTQVKIIFLILLLVFFFAKGMLFQALATVIVTMAAMVLLYIIFAQSQRPLLLAITAVAFGVTFQAGWEIARFIIAPLIGYMHISYEQVIQNLFICSVASGLTALIAYSFLKQGNIVSKLLEKASQANPHLFSKYITNTKIIKQLISKGENKNLEFKSTVRFNLHTNQFDKRIEYTIIKSMAAFLNSEGGTLLVGVKDDGEIIGIEKDNFPNKDKCNLFITHLIRQNLGNQHAHLIQYQILEINNKQIIKIDAKPSTIPVFLQNGNDEEFYIRAGASSTPLSGSKLIAYIKKRFKRF